MTIDTPSPVHIRLEKLADREAVHALNFSAFGGPGEAKLVDALRNRAAPIVSLVAEDGRAIVGHIFFSPVTLTCHPDLNIMGLAPMAVAPDRQRRGVGTALVNAGLQECQKLDCGAVVVLGHPEYYPRFGFAPAAAFGIACEYDVPSEAFMALELSPGYLQDARGTIKYHQAFSEL